MGYCLLFRLFMRCVPGWKTSQSKEISWSSVSHVTLDQSAWRIMMSRMVPLCTTQPMVSTRAANCTRSSAAGITPVHCRQESEPSRYQQIKSFCSLIPRLEASTWVSAIHVATDLNRSSLVPSFQTGGWELGTEHLSGSLDSSWSRWWATSFLPWLVKRKQKEVEQKCYSHTHRERAGILTEVMATRTWEKEV